MQKLGKKLAAAIESPNNAPEQVGVVSSKAREKTREPQPMIPANRLGPRRWRRVLLRPLVLTGMALRKGGLQNLFLGYQTNDTHPQGIFVLALLGRRLKIVNLSTCQLL